MKNTKPIVLPLTVFALLTAIGCGVHATTSRMTTGSTDGRQLTVEVDERASFKTRDGKHVITFSGHELVVGNERLVVDRDRKSFGIPATAKKVAIEISNGVLTMTVDGSRLIKTPI